MAIQAFLNGARLSFVVVELEGTVQRPRAIYSKKNGLTTKIVEEPAGFMVYFPRGHVLRMKDRDMLKRHQLDQSPRIINLDGLLQGSMLEMLTKQDSEQRGHVPMMETLEKQVIALATAKTGPRLLPEQHDNVPQVEKAVA